MKFRRHIATLTRRLLLSGRGAFPVLLALLFSLPSPALAEVNGGVGADSAAGRSTDGPDFARGSFFVDNTGWVRGIHAGVKTDLVLVEGGYDSGFRNGMVCLVLEEGELIGEILLAEVRNRCAAAVILELVPGRVIATGHLVQIKAVAF